MKYIAGIFAIMSLFTLNFQAEEKPDLGTKPVAVVNGEAITLRMLEDEMLRKEGSEKIEELVRHELENMPWSTLTDGDTLVAMGNWRLSRASLTAQMLSENAGPIRAEMIRIKVIKQALDKAGIVIDQATIDGEIARMQHKVQEQLSAQGQGKIKVDFASYIQQTQKISLEEFTRQPGFQIMAGMHRLVAMKAKEELSDDDLRAYFDSHRDRYRKDEAVDLSTIFVPYRSQAEIEGQVATTNAERGDRMKVMNELYAAIDTGKQSFAVVWKFYGQAYDRDAGPGGAIGWVTRAGRREQPDARTLLPPVVEAAFAAKEPFPVLLPPIATDVGIEIVQVKGHRPAQEPDFAALKNQVRDECINDQLEARTKALSKSLYDASEVEHVSMPDLIRARKIQAGIPSDDVPTKP